MSVACLHCTFVDVCGMRPSDDCVIFPLPFSLPQSFLTPVRVNGGLSNAMLACAVSLRPHAQWLTSYLSLFFRDDLQSWLASQPGAEVKLDEAVEGNVSGILARLGQLCQLPSADGNTPSFVKQLIAAATDECNLARMDPNWHPWF